jgi:hypothetical protein
MSEMESVAVKVEALRNVVKQMDRCLAELDRLGAELAAARLAHAIETVQSDIADITMH